MISLEIIDFLKEKNVLRKTPPFSLDCKKDMIWYDRADSKDLYTWRCSTCGNTNSMRKYGFLCEFKFPMNKTIKMIHAFAFKYNIKDTCANLNFSNKTVIRFFKKCFFLGLINFMFVDSMFR